MSVTPHQAEASRTGGRIRRHIGELVKLSWPAVVARMGLIFMAQVDTVMVGHYAARELAYLQLGNGTAVMFLLVVSLGMLMGVLISTANAFGRDDFAECGRVWRRSLPYALGLGLLSLVLCMPAVTIFDLLGQTDELAREGGRIMRILALGLPAHLLYVVCVFFLEGIKRPRPAMYFTIVLNIVNAGLNWVLIYGHWGLPELGAEGSAWTTTVVRWLMAAGGIAYVFCHPELRAFGVRRPTGQTWRQWGQQRRLGYASAISLGAEVGAFGALNIFAGWLGAFDLAAYSIAFMALTLPFMLAAGVGVATAVRTGFAHARGDIADTALAGWTGMGLVGVVLVAIGLGYWLGAPYLTAAYSDSPALVPIALPMIAFCALILPFDGGQTVASAALRGLGETWWPTVIQTFSYVVVMIPLSWALALPLGRGPMGLMEAILIASIVSTLLQGLRFHWLTGRSPRTGYNR